jgi:DNA-binding Xre family transcriptional regulator
MTEMNTKIFLGGKERPVRKAHLTAICEPIVYKL